MELCVRLPVVRYSYGSIVFVYVYRERYDIIWIANIIYVGRKFRINLRY